MEDRIKKLEELIAVLETHIKLNLHSQLEQHKALIQILEELREDNQPMGYRKG